MTNRSLAPALVGKLLILRTVVAALGERTTPPWWRSQLLTEVGLRTMTRIFPRTALSAALDSVMVAARTDHDSRVGVGDRFHLFRLTPGLEQEISKLMADEHSHEEITALLRKNREDVLKELSAMAEGRVLLPAEGPIAPCASQPLMISIIG